mmetsp:Transcript_21616/g.35675  ORF Transcript_21616/g.35675 Transcript_21616/m.35675 type:complete len:144 (-) Transcript_21616:84-515(-)|eukprot:CAMPEP_0119309022 /NCGR_PEP_ID=MMETSP1333-20130426/13663_1 /TAXON_ID=418940 /ORGANISM="Scyphosphaera apsteinii, Strain RCC1455" /LENGTH=143 /DNA_ID=CAMNT_0007312925 /DNA_START=71 /DNA_END=502 /DNA_ORIENTATION=+
MLLVAALITQTTAFTPAAAFASRNRCQLASPIVMVQKSEDERPPKKTGIDLSGLMQVVSMGAGAPMLGDLKKTNFKKPEAEDGAALQFELEANNFDLDSRGTYFDSGYVGGEDDYTVDFFANLMSGGKLQREADERRRKGQGK